MNNQDRYKLRPICWANGNGCGEGKDGELNKEHVVSRSILKLYPPFSASRKNKKDINLGVGSYVLRRLCHSHNRRLSDYDKEGLKLFRTLRNVVTHKEDENLQVGDDGVYVMNLNRWNLERWYAKTYFNYLLFNWTALKPERSPFPLSPHALLDQLYEGKEFNKPFGLYLINFDTPLFKSDKQVEINVLNCESRVIKQSGEISDMFDFPQLFYTHIHGVELVGLFNVTQISDVDAINGPLKPMIDTLKEKAVQDFSGLEVSVRKHGQGKNRVVRIMLS